MKLADIILALEDVENALFDSASANRFYDEPEMEDVDRQLGFDLQNVRDAIEHLERVRNA